LIILNSEIVDSETQSGTSTWMKGCHLAEPYSVFLDKANSTLNFPKQRLR